MNFPENNFEGANINAMQTALNAACEQLGIVRNDKKCAAVALLIFGCARTGQTDVSKLTAFAIERFECAL
jgi:hypothetical protein